MTDEERFCNKRCHSNPCRRRCEYVSSYIDGLTEGRKEGYEQGYEDCRHYAHDYYKPKWHDLRKNPDDLADRMGINSKEVYVAYSDNDCTDFASYNFNTGNWERSEDNLIASIVIAWCELPKFEE